MLQVKGDFISCTVLLVATRMRKETLEILLVRKCRENCTLCNFVVAAFFFGWKRNISNSLFICPNI
jgi:hypothetical protein